MGKLGLTVRRIMLCSALGAAGTHAHTTHAEALYNDVRFMATDLIDDLVYSWINEKPFASHQGIVLTDVRAPVGLDERFDQIVENRLYELFQINPQIPVTLIHCSICRDVITKSTPDKTYMGIGADDPEVLENVARSSPGALGLSIVFEARGQELDLRAVVFQLTGVQKIVWARRFSTSASSALALQRGDQLLSLADARKRQEDLFARRDPVEVTTRLTLRLYNAAKESEKLPPMPFIEQSFEGIVMPSRRTRLGVTVGFTSVRDTYEGWSAGGHISRLMFRDTPHLSEPDLYWTLGFNYIRLRGPGALPFAEDEIDVQRIRNRTEEPKATLLSYRLGLELHVKYRFGLLMFIEDTPLLKDSEVIATKRLIGIPYQNYGFGMVIRW